MFSHHMLMLAKRFEEAIECYTKAIELSPTVAVYYGNRSFAYLKTESYGYALSDATRALELDKSYVKVCMERERVVAWTGPPVF